ncbi:hypothetical protein B0I73DRAFT_131313 [Yarrowia lipolytica]|nr:hypothetical protein B0I73DRAFT_131313 [Yarrowia lipolytica]
MRASTDAELAEQGDNIAPLQEVGSNIDTTQSKRHRFGTQRRTHSVNRRRSLFQKLVHPERVEVDNTHEITDEAHGPSRTVYFNEPLPEDQKDPKTGNPLAHYVRNKIRTTKYTPITFVPKNLWYQFHNVANIYFLLIAILSAFSIFGVQSAGLAAVPIIVIVVLTAIKDAIEDYRRQILDMEVNNNVTRVLDGIENPNVEEDDVGLWRRFKKANSRFWGPKGRAFVRLFMPKQRRIESKEKEQELHRVLSNTTVITARMSSDLGGRPSGVSRGRRSDVRRSDIGRDVRPSMDLGRPSMDRDQRRSSVRFSGDFGEGPAGDSRTLRASTDNRDSKNPGEFSDDPTVIDYNQRPEGVAKFRKKYWKQVNVGDIVRVLSDDEVPADIVVLSTSDDDGACYIETRNLDGETNLKVRQALSATKGIRHASDFERSHFEVMSEPPHANMYSYNGVLKWRNTDGGAQSEPINSNNLLLRGCSVRNTRWVMGLVVFTGDDTKIVLNTGETPAKRSRMTRELNINVWSNVVLLAVLSIVAAAVQSQHFRRHDTSDHFFEFGIVGGTYAVGGLVTFFTFLIVLQSLVPISLYISIEIVKTCHAFFIYNDIDMYYAPLDYPCTPKSWSISDDLGQIEYIFSDKTGTLTQNVMEFKQCTIGGKSYGKVFTEAMLGLRKRQGANIDTLKVEMEQDIADDRQLMAREMAKVYHNPYLTAEPTFVSSDIIRDLEGASGPDQQKHVHYFLLALALCHSVLPEVDEEGVLVFKAQSPDEAALVSTARDLGFTVVERTRKSVVVDVMGKRIEYDILAMLEFNSTRKRMSTVVRLPDTGKIVLLCKGADSVILSRLNRQINESSLVEETARDLDRYANEGLRTLCLAHREISEREYEQWYSLHSEAARAIENREDKMDEVAEQIERDLRLLGGTAIEDRLQEGVPNSIALLAMAGIKLWVLTGDKVETAVNIGYSCNLLDNSMELITIQVKNPTVESVGAVLDEFAAKYNIDTSKEALKAAKKDHSPPKNNAAVVIDGDALTVALSDPLRIKFLLLCKNCKSVLCCRVSPAQKASVVSLVKKSLDVMTLAIGDGANDVSMIQEADVGVGIAGVEGRQAVMSSDYGIGQFRFLNKLLLVHGRWGYRRIAELTANLFYKNIVFAMTIFWFQVHTAMDGVMLFDYTYITLFNLAFTSLPVILLGIFDQDVSWQISIAVPQLYRRGILRLEWTQWKFWGYMLDGLFQSVICYFFTYLTFYKGHVTTNVGREINYREAYGAYAGTASMIACNIYVQLNMYQWSKPFLIICWVSSALVFAWTGIYTQFTASQLFYKTAQHLYGALNFWTCLLLMIIVCILPRLLGKCVHRSWFPMDIDIVREMWWAGEFNYLEGQDIDTIVSETTQNYGTSAREKPGYDQPPTDEYSDPNTDRVYKSERNSFMESATFPGSDYPIKGYSTSPVEMDNLEKRPQTDDSHLSPFADPNPNTSSPMQPAGRDVLHSDDDEHLVPK